MSETASRYPLSWPVGWVRTNPGFRRRAQFGRVGRDAGGRSTGKRALTIAEAVDRLGDELRRLRATNELLSTNVPLNLQGWPMGRSAEPQDPGAAVYFRLKGRARSLACDKWDRVADNIAAIAEHIEALRAVERYGVGSIEQAFAGYAALTSGKRSWWEVLGFKGPDGVTREAVEDTYRRLAKERHPDTPGGTHDAFTELGEAKDSALLEVAS